MLDNSFYFYPLKVFKSLLHLPRAIYMMHGFVTLASSKCEYFIGKCNI